MRLHNRVASYSIMCVLSEIHTASQLILTTPQPLKAAPGLTGTEEPRATGAQSLPWLQGSLVKYISHLLSEALQVPEQYRPSPYLQ